MCVIVELYGLIGGVNLMQMLKCPHCGKYNTLRKAGHQDSARTGHQIQQYRCKACCKSTTKPVEVSKDDKGRFISNKPVNES